MAQSQSRSDRMKLSVPPPLRQVLDRNAKAAGMKAPEYLRALIVSDDRIRRLPGPERK